MNKLSIRTAIIVPFMLVQIIILIIIVYVTRGNYSRLSIDQGTKIIENLNTIVQNKITTVLEEPKIISEVYAQMIMENDLFRYDSFSEIEKMTVGITKRVHSTLPQITTLGYGDENKNFIGVRANDNDTYTLMVKDSNTNNLLNIYDGDNRNTPVVASYEDYDPRTRPWYKPVLESPVVQWSDIYINLDGVNDATIS